MIHDGSRKNLQEKDIILQIGLDSFAAVLRASLQKLTLLVW